MSRRRVWAPLARNVELIIGSQRYPMRRDAGGWWSAAVGFQLAASDYAFSIDGKNPIPDPRSPWQPTGIHGFSRPVDHSSYPWNDSGWQQVPLSSAIIYECHVGTFTAQGTFDSALEHLDYLRDLGVTHIELMPVNEFPGSRGWGYDGVDLFAPHQAYGGPFAMKSFVDECHRHRLGVILDVVYNHFGPDGNYLSNFGPYLTDRYQTPWGQAVNLDGEGSFEVRRFLCDNALMWLRDYHVDGLRIDAVHAIFDSFAVHFLEQLQSEIQALEASSARHLIAIAESDLNLPRIVAPTEAGGYGLDAQWNDDFHHALHTLFTGESAGYYTDYGSIADVAKAITDVFVYDGRYSRFRRRAHGRPTVGLKGHRFIGFLQNHDQIGNRAKGERLGHLISVDCLKISAALLLTSPFVPFLFQGEEWNASSPFQYFTEHTDRRLADAICKGRRLEFAHFVTNPEEVPDPQARETFERSKLDWGERSREPHLGILNWYRSLIQIRRRVSDLTDGRMERTKVDFDESARWLHVRRGECSIVCNLGNIRQRIALPGPMQIELASKNPISISATDIDLAPFSVAILSPKDLEP